MYFPEGILPQNQPTTNRGKHMLKLENFIRWVSRWLVSMFNNDRPSLGMVKHIVACP